MSKRRAKVILCMQMVWPIILILMLIYNQSDNRPPLKDVFNEQFKKKSEQ